MRPTIFIDLDGTLIWTWTPRITSAFMALVFGLPICTPPTSEEGYLKLTKVFIGDTGKYSLSCRRPNIGHFLRSLRALADVHMLTHASRDYARAMNRAFALGFTEAHIFAVTENNQVLIDTFCEPQRLTLLIDDEGPGWSRRWRGERNRDSYRDDRAEIRHQVKCRCVGIKPDSHRDIAYPKFSGRKDDLFCRTAFRRTIILRIAKVLQQHRRKGTR